jgi:hypothetical protein
MATLQQGECSVTNGSKRVVGTIDADWSLVLPDTLFHLRGTKECYIVETTTDNLTSDSGFWEATLTVAYRGTSDASAKYTLADDFAPLLAALINTSGSDVDEPDNCLAILMARAVTTGGSGTGGHTIQNEGSNMNGRMKLNFVGSAVNVTDDPGNNATIVTITAADMLKSVYDTNNDGRIDIAAGGTGAATALDARLNLGLGSSAVLDVPSSGDASSGQVVKGNDSRLTNSRTPTTHSHTVTDLNLSGRSVSTTHSLTGGGNLGADLTLSLVNDTATPGNNKVYGTNSSGVRGWFDASGLVVGAGDMLKADYDSNSDGFVDVAAGGTGAGTASGARTNLGLVIGTDVAAFSHTHAQSDITSLVSDLAAKVPTSRTISTTSSSLTGGGDLSANRSLALVNDNNTPGNNKVYGTDGSGVKGWQSIVITGDMLASVYDPNSDGVIAIAQGGTGATTASAARSALGLVIGTDVAAFSHTHNASAITAGTLDANRVPTYVGATPSSDGIKGAVPSAPSGDRDKFLKGDGTWQNVENSDADSIQGIAVTADDPTDGQILAYNASNDELEYVDPPEPSGGGSLDPRAEIDATTGSLAANSSDEDVEFAVGKASNIFRIETSHPARVRLYTSEAKRTADAARPVSTDPVAGTGVILEVVTDLSNLTIDLTPAVFAANLEGTPVNVIPAIVQNLSGSTNAITVTLTRIEIEE